MKFPALILRDLFMVAATLAAPVCAQVPDGWIAYCSSTNAAGFAGGIWFAHPRTPTWGPLPAVTGLPADLVVPGVPHAGANCILVERGTGHLLVGEGGPAGTAIELRRIALNGTSATVLTTTFVGVVAPGAQPGGITQLAQRNDGSIVFSMAGLDAAGPLGAAVLGAWDLSTGAVQPVATPGLSGRSSAVAFDPRIETTYFTVFTPNTPAGARDRIHALDVLGNLRTVRDSMTVNSLAVDSQGRLVHNDNTYVVVTDPATGALSAVGSTLNALPNCIVVEPATDEPLGVTTDAYAPNGSVFWSERATGTHTILVAQPSGLPTGIAVQPSPRSYGSGTDGFAVTRWRTAPNPGGLPRTGNSGFGILVEQWGAPIAPGLLAASFAPASTTLAGASVLLDPGSAVVVGTIATGTPFALPIPALQLGGVRIHFQAFFADAGAPFGIASSNGLLVGVIQ